MDYYINYPGISVPAYQSFLKLSINPWNAGTINRESKGSSTSLGVLNPLCHHPCIAACSAWGQISVLIKVKKIDTSNKMFFNFVHPIEGK